MTAPATTRRAGPFNGNGATTSFPFTFKVFATSDIQVIKTSASKNRGQAITDAIKAIDSSDRTILGIDEEARAIDAKHWPLDDAGFPMKAAQTEGLVLRTVTTVERVRG